MNGPVARLDCRPRAASRRTRGRRAGQSTQGTRGYGAHLDGYAAGLPGHPDPLGRLYTLFFAAAIILPFVLALVLTLVLGPAMRLLNRRLRIPNMVAALMLIVVLFSVIGVLGFAVSVPASGWIARAPQSLPALLERLSFLWEPIRLVQHGVQQGQNLMTQSGESGQQQTGGSG